ncbi:hypothetical protein C8Q72DRAFT_814396 [Fomitopsis betulina]|nr:hypothetical protein C8Q72DRAFT_814396 [Fomitopsis betulina]
MRTTVVCVLALAASASAAYSSNEDLYAREFDEELYARDLEARWGRKVVEPPPRKSNGVLNGLGLVVGAAVAAQGLNAAIEKYRGRYATRSDEDLYRRNFNEDLYERDLDAELEARNLGGLIGHASSLASVAQAVAAFRQRSDDDLWARAFGEYDQLD